MSIARASTCLAAATLVAALINSSSAHAFTDRDCSDFTYQQDAQKLLDSTPGRDPHRLDRDGDGIACELLPRRNGATSGTSGTSKPSTGGTKKVQPVVTVPKVAHSDWTGDGKADLLAITPTGTLRVYPGNGNGTLAAGRTIGSGWSAIDLLSQAGDWNGDRKADLIARRGNELILYTGNGHGGVTSSRTLGSGWGGVRALLGPADWTGDGKPDLLAVKTVDSTMWLYPGNGRGGIGAGQRTGSWWTTISALNSVVDWNGDKRPDVIARGHDGRLRMYPGNGRGGLGSATLLGSGWDSFTAFSAPGDLTGDGNADLLAVSATGQLKMYPGNGRSRFGSGSKSYGSGWGAMTLAGDNTVTLNPNQPTPRATTPAPLP